MTHNVIEFPVASARSPRVDQAQSNPSDYESRLRFIEIEAARLEERTKVIEATMVTKTWLLGAIVAVVAISSSIGTIGALIISNVLG